MFGLRKDVELQIVTACGAVIMFITALVTIELVKVLATLAVRTLAWTNPGLTDAVRAYLDERRAAQDAADRLEFDQIYAWSIECERRDEERARVSHYREEREAREREARERARREQIPARERRQVRRDAVFRVRMESI